MAQYAINNSRVLIIPGYTDKETLQMADKNNKTEVTLPPSLYFDAQNIESNIHRKSFEEFRSAEGLIMLEKACDEYASVSMDILVHQNLSNVKGSITIDSQTKEARLRVTDNSTITQDVDEGLQLSRWVDPEEFNEEYIEIRNNFFKDLLGRPLTIVSPLFDPMPVAYLAEDYSYNIGEGEQEASYHVTFKEVNNIGF